MSETRRIRKRRPSDPLRFLEFFPGETGAGHSRVPGLLTVTMNWKDHLVAALGYHELGMHQDALIELDRIPESHRQRLEPLRLRLSVLQTMTEWEQGAALAREAIGRYPESGDLFLAGAYCIRRAETLEAAFAFLEQGRSCLETEPCFWFNLGCYHCQFGRLEETKECVERAIALDGNYRTLAAVDGDLEPLRESGWTG